MPSEHLAFQALPFRAPSAFRDPRLWCLLVSSVVGCATAACSKQDPKLCAESPGELFERRIEPLLRSEHPNTCAECHTAGLDLEGFLRPDVCESMACLQQSGLVNLNAPEQSVILAWIDRAEPSSNLITEEIIAEERAAFLAWIEHEAACQSCAKATCVGREARTCDRNEDLEGVFSQKNDPGDCERPTLERLFRGTVYAERDRCSPCHFEEEKTAARNAPRWLHRTGDCMVSSLASLRSIEESGYIDADDPKSSLLLLKPLAEFQGGLKHGGHDKFVKDGDPGYDAFLYFLERYGACATDPEMLLPAGGAAGR